MILKILMVLFNCVIFFAGVVLALFGFLVKLSRKYLQGMLENVTNGSEEPVRLHSAGYLLMAVGVILTIMGFLGCCGACCENKCMLGAYFIIILVVFAIEVIAAAFVLFNQPTAEKLLDKFGKMVTENIKNSYDQNEILTKVWNETMAVMKCCGYNNYTDFTGSSFVNRTSLYPEPCCPAKPKPCDIKKAELENVDGCFSTVVKLVKSRSTWLGGVAICIAGIEVAVMIISLIMYRR